MNQRRIELCETACRMAWARVGINIKDKETTCPPPLAGGPKSLISRRGLNRLDYFTFARLFFFPRPCVGEGWGEGEYTSVQDYDVTLYRLLRTLLGLFSSEQHILHVITNGYKIIYR